MSRSIYTEQTRDVVQAALALIEGRIARVETEIDSWRRDLLAGTGPAIVGQSGEQQK
jgi:hypothetical protein